MGYIYKITNTVNNKVYIGQTVQTVEERYQKHLFEARQHANRYLYDAMNHYGYDKFNIEAIEVCNDEFLDDREKYWIGYYRSNDRCFGYNMTEGGGGGNTFARLSPERQQQLREKASKRLTGVKQPKEVVEKRAASLRGRKLTEEHRQRLSEIHKERFKNLPGTRLGATASEETKQKIREANLGKKQSDETKLKRKETLSKLKWWNNGIKNLRAAECPEGYVAGRINFTPSAESKAKSSHKGTKWFTNGKENRMAYECPEGFWPGKTFKKDLSK